jgi:hypothetical protein
MHQVVVTEVPHQDIGAGGAVVEDQHVGPSWDLAEGEEVFGGRDKLQRDNLIGAERCFHLDAAVDQANDQIIGV